MTFVLNIEELKCFEINASLTVGLTDAYVINEKIHKISTNIFFN